MPTYQTTGIVIGRTNFGEADRVIRLFTAEHGKLSVVAKGVRRIKSRAAGHLEPFGEVNLTLTTGRGSLDVITSARLQWYPHALTTDYARLERAFTLTTRLDRLTEPGESHPKVYRALDTLLRELDTGPGTALLELWYTLQLLNALGYRPELGQCLLCGYNQPDRAYYFDATRGGLVCERDTTPGPPAMSIPAIKLWRLMSDHPYEQIRQLQNGPELANLTKPLADAFLTYHAIG
ncbi:MAG TPA: DNA repair protein RecO [Candidatus Saccharimonadia bacterium]